MAKKLVAGAGIMRKPYRLTYTPAVPEGAAPKPEVHDFVRLRDAIESAEKWMESWSGTAEITCNPPGFPVQLHRGGLGFKVLLVSEHYEAIGVILAGEGKESWFIG